MVEISGGISDTRPQSEASLPIRSTWAHVLAMGDLSLSFLHCKTGSVGDSIEQ